MAELVQANLPLIIGLLFTGGAAGLLAGLLGVGGGIVIVPVLYTVLAASGVAPEIQLHMAVATSLATIIPTSIASLRAHNTKSAVDWSLFQRWLPGLLVGVAIGTWLATTQLKGTGLALVFAIVALGVAVDLIARDRSESGNDIAADASQFWFYRVQASWVPTTIGALSAMMGIGGGTLSVPFLNAAKYPIHKAVGTSAGFGLIIAVPATAGYIFGGWDIPNRPVGSVGYVNLLGVLAITLATVVTAPIGSRIAHALSARTLRLLFAAFLFVTALRMSATFL